MASLAESQAPNNTAALPAMAAVAVGSWPMGAIHDLVRKLSEETDQKSVGRQLGVGESTISQFLAGKRGLGLEPLLLLSVISGRSPADILVAAGKHDELKLLQQSFGPAAKVRTVPLPSDAAMAVARVFDALEPEQQDAIRSVLACCGHFLGKPHAEKGDVRLHKKAKAG